MLLKFFKVIKGGGICSKVLRQSSKHSQLANQLLQLDSSFNMSSSHFQTDTFSAAINYVQGLFMSYQNISNLVNACYPDLTLHLHLILITEAITNEKTSEWGMCQDSSASPTPPPTPPPSPLDFGLCSLSLDSSPTPSLLFTSFKVSDIEG